MKSNLIIIFISIFSAVLIGFFFRYTFHNVEQLEMGLSDAYTYTGDVMVENMRLRDTAEGIAAFLEKRPPDWS